MRLLGGESVQPLIVGQAHANVTSGKYGSLKPLSFCPETEPAEVPVPGLL